MEIIIKWLLGVFLLFNISSFAQELTYSSLDHDNSKATCVAFSPDGRLASASHDGKIFFWNPESKQLDNILDEHQEIVLKISFSPDGTLLASGGKDKSVLIWNVSGGVLKYKLLGHTEPITSLAFSHDGKILASGSADKTVILWDLATGKKLEVLAHHKKEVSCLAFAQNVNLLATGSYDGTIKIYNVKTNQIEKQFSPNAGKIRSIAFSPDGRLMATGTDDETIKLWDYNAGAIKRTFTGHKDDVYDLSFSPDGQYLASGCMGNEVKIWSLERSEMIYSFQGFYKFLGLAFSYDGKYLAIADLNLQIRLYNTESLKITPNQKLINLASRKKYGAGLVLSNSYLKISNPVSSADNYFRTNEKTVLVKGNVVSDAGLFMLLVDGSETSIDADGKFTKEVKLKYFENNIIVKAIDVDKKVSEDTIHVYRIFDKNSPDEVAGNKRRGKDFALIIATDEYDAMHKLSNPVNDAKTISRELKDYYGFTVDELYNPTLNEIYGTIRKYNKMQFSDDDQLFIFIAGHGEYDEVFREGYLVAKDSKKGDDSRLTYLSHSNLRTLVNNIPCKHILLNLDACFGGTFDQTLASRGDDQLYNGINKDEFVVRKLKYKTRLYLTSGGKEYVPDGRPGQHSPFARKLLEALRSYGGDDGVLTIREMLNYVEKVQPEPRNGEFGDNQPGSDFLFIKKN